MRAENLALSKRILATRVHLSIMRHSMANKVVTRFAPSPTGYLHVGGARTALFSFLLARHFGGEFLLRIEDTDLARSTEQAVHQLLDDLRWLGLNWDNRELVVQSKRLNQYNAIIDDLIKRGLAYKAYETLEELDARKREAEKSKRTYIYRRPQLTDDQIRSFESENRPHVVRFAMPVKDYYFDDAVLGPGQGVNSTQLQDFIIRKSDGMPTYHFAVVVDDAEMNVTHVLRGQEHLLNTVNHIALQEALGYPRPIYAHLPVILNPQDGSKMSKRDRDKLIRQRAQNWLKTTKNSAHDLAAKTSLASSRVDDWLSNKESQLDIPEQQQVMQVIGLKNTDLPEILVHDFRKAGYLPEAMLNFLALLGWNPGGDRERMTTNELVELFTIEGIGKSNAKFNREKLLAFNTELAANSNTARLVKAFKDYLAVNPDSPLNRANDEQLAKMLEMKKGFRLLRDVDEASRFLFVADDEITYQPDAVEKVLKKSDGQGLTVLRDLKPILASIPTWDHATIESALNAYGAEKQLGLGKIAQPIRVAVSGGTISPPIFESLEFLGKEKTLARIDRCLANG
jgi:glutamyl-tRNA synthetase